MDVRAIIIAAATAQPLPAISISVISDPVPTVTAKELEEYRLLSKKNCHSKYLSSARNLSKCTLIAYEFPVF